MKQLDQTTRWILDDLLNEPIDRDIDRYLAALEQQVSGMESSRKDCSDSIPVPKFLAILNLLESIETIIRRLQAYSYLWLSEDTQNKAALNLRDRLDQALVQLGNRVLFFEIWFKDLPDDDADRLIAESGDLRYFLESIRRFKPHTLSETEEKILSLKDPNGIDAVIGLYEMITNRFTFNLKINGKKKILTRDELTSYYYHESPEVRAAAYKELYRVYTENSTILAQIYSHRVRDWHSEGMELRKYASPISARNLGNDLPDDVVETLLAVCRQNAAVFQEYFRLKAKYLGVDKIRRCDIYTPVSKSVKNYDFSTAMQMVLKTFEEFSPEMFLQATRVFVEQHLDSETRKGKRGGAFCYGALPQLTPWVLVSFNGQASEVATLAHEMGHAIHSMLASSHSVLSFHPPQPLAETASIFAEMLLTDRWLIEEKDPAVRKDLLIRIIDDAYASVMRQAFFTIFEKDAHRMIVEGNTFDEVADHYLALLKEQFGDSLELSDEFKWEWITVPHFYDSPFYTYSYSFGQLLVLALYQQYRQEGSQFIPRYLKILSYGGSRAPMQVLQDAGLDITTPEFWQGGFDVIKQMIADLSQIK